MKTDTLEWKGKNLFLSSSEIDSISESLEANGRENAHFGVSMRTDGDGTKQEIIEIPSLWINMDFGPSEEDGNDRLLKVFFEFPLEPTFIIQSGGGVHVYWKLKEPLQRENIPRAENLLKRLASHLGGDMAATDASRLLRIPGSFNYKYVPERLVEIWKSSRHEYDPTDFDFLPPIENVVPISVLKKDHLPGWEKELLEGVSEGERNISITRLAGRCLTKGLSREEIPFLA